MHHRQVRSDIADRVQHPCAVDPAPAAVANAWLVCPKLQRERPHAPRRFRRRTAPLSGRLRSKDSISTAPTAATSSSPSGFPAGHVRFLSAPPTRSAWAPSWPTARYDISLELSVLFLTVGADASRDSVNIIGSCGGTPRALHWTRRAARVRRRLSVVARRRLCFDSSADRFAAALRQGSWGLVLLL